MKKLFLVFALFLSLVSPLFAAGDEPAVLRMGPVSHNGIEFLGMNVIPSYYGEYDYQGRTVRLYYTVSPIVLSGRWAESDCRRAGLLELTERTSGDESVFAYSDSRGWTAFLAFPHDADFICGFIDKYISRQNYFLNIARDKSVFSFPAILE